jgi:hypothetical protein
VGGALASPLGASAISLEAPALLQGALLEKVEETLEAAVQEGEEGGHQVGIQGRGDREHDAVFTPRAEGAANNSMDREPVRGGGHGVRESCRSGALVVVARTDMPVVFLPARRDPQAQCLNR